MVDVRTELALIQKHIRQHNREAGEFITWFEFSPFSTSPSAGSTYDDVYDEGPPGDGGRSYKAGIVIPTIYVNETEDKFLQKEDARQPTQNLEVTMLYDDVLRSGMTAPREYAPHLNDLFMYDSRWYKVDDYHVRGRLIQEEVIIGVRGFEIFLDQEFMWDDIPVEFSVETYWPVVLPTL